MASLKSYNTFNINAQSTSFEVFRSLSGLVDILDNKPSEQRVLVLGGGSNILFTHDFDGLVIKNEIFGIQLLREDDEYYFVQSGAGENWHRFVLYCLGHDYYGLENLSLIPGCVGASPIQNIGAYGVEIKDVFHELEAYDMKEQRVRTFGVAECAFGYRDSIFKHAFKNKLVILNVTYRLKKQPDLHTSYGAIETELARTGVTQITPKAISDAVVRIRSSKLPDPAVIGNAGSFFKNPVIAQDHYERLQSSDPLMPGYPAGQNQVKVPAGWLIEKCGWKGYRKGDVGCYEKQALVLVNYGDASGKEVYDLSEEIIQSVFSGFGITLEREVNIL